MTSISSPARSGIVARDAHAVAHCDLRLISLKQFDFIRNLALQHAGIALADHKLNMVHRRVSKRLAALGLDSFADYCALLSGPDGMQELQPLINALTTNKTAFFREKHHFDHLAATAVPCLVRANASGGSRKLRIWSAGCSSGQEPYSIAMTLDQCGVDLRQWDAKILATDIDTDMIDLGRRAVYTSEEIATIPSSFRTKLVEKLPDTPLYFQMAPALRARVTFKQLNLHGAWPMKGRFDAIFCRNVVIYFDKPSQRRLLDRFADLLHEGGFLYIGHSESLYRVTERFRAAGPSIYRKVA